MWTLIGAAASVLYGKYKPTIIHILVISAAFFIGHFFFLAHPIQESLEYDKYLFSKYRKKIEELIEEDEVTSGKSDEEGEEKHCSEWKKFKWQLIKWPLITSTMSIILLIFVLFMLHLAKYKNVSVDKTVQPIINFNY